MDTEGKGGKPLRLVHHHAGYFRAQADVFIGSSDGNSAVEAAKAVAQATPGFLSWSHSEKTGSFVIQYEPGPFCVDDVALKIAQAVGLESVEMDIHNSRHRKALVEGIIGAVEEVNDIVYEATGKKADLRELIPGALAINAVVAFVLGDDRPSRLPSWDSALYRAYRVFAQTHKKEISKREKKKKKKRDKKGREFLQAGPQTDATENSPPIV